MIVLRKLVILKIEVVNVFVRSGVFFVFKIILLLSNGVVLNVLKLNKK